MEDHLNMLDPNRHSKKRSFKEAFTPNELGNKFSSKQDLISYLNEHCKYKDTFLTSCM